MANPKLENGFTQISNELLEALSRIHLSPAESRLVFAILRSTYGWLDKATCKRKTMDKLSHSQLMKKTGMPRRTVIRALVSMRTRNIIICQHAKCQVTKIGIQTDYDAWRQLPVARSVTLSSRPVILMNGAKADVKIVTRAVPLLALKLVPSSAPKVVTTLAPTKERVNKEKERFKESQTFSLSFFSNEKVTDDSTMNYKNSVSPTEMTPEEVNERRSLLLRQGEDLLKKGY